jgi:hypothetical protein
LTFWVQTLCCVALPYSHAKHAQSPFEPRYLMGFRHLSMGSEHPSGVAVALAETVNPSAGSIMVVLAQPLTEKGACKELPRKSLPSTRHRGVRRTGVISNKIGRQREQLKSTDFLTMRTSSSILQIHF